MDAKEFVKKRFGLTKKQLQTAPSYISYGEIIDLINEYMEQVEAEREKDRKEMIELASKSHYWR